MIHKINLLIISLLTLILFCVGSCTTEDEDSTTSTTDGVILIPDPEEQEQDPLTENPDESLVEGEGNNETYSVSVDGESTNLLENNHPLDGVEVDTEIDIPISAGNSTPGLNLDYSLVEITQTPLFIHWGPEIEYVKPNLFFPEDYVYIEVEENISFLSESVDLTEFEKRYQLFQWETLKSDRRSILNNFLEGELAKEELESSELYYGKNIETPNYLEFNGSDIIQIGIEISAIPIDESQTNFWWEWAAVLRINGEELNEILNIHHLVFIFPEEIIPLNNENNAKGVEKQFSAQMVNAETQLFYFNTLIQGSDHGNAGLQVEIAYSLGDSEEEKYTQFDLQLDTIFKKQTLDLIALGRSIKTWSLLLENEIQCSQVNLDQVTLQSSKEIEVIKASIAKLCNITEE